MGSDKPAASEGELKGAVLQQVPYVSSYCVFLRLGLGDFFPHSAFYGEQK